MHTYRTYGINKKCTVAMVFGVGSLVLGPAFGGAVLVVSGLSLFLGGISYVGAGSKERATVGGVQTSLTQVKADLQKRAKG